MAQDVIDAVVGKAKQFNLFITDEDDSPTDITGFSFIQLKLIGALSEIIQLCEPMAAAVDEVQLLSFSTVPDVGSFVANIGINKSTAILFSDNAAAVQTKLRAIKGFSALTVSGDFTLGFTVTFTGNDGSQNVPQIAISDAITLLTGATLVTVTPTTVTPGSESEGITVVTAGAGHLLVRISSDNMLLMPASLAQDMDLTVKIGADVLDVPTIKGKLNVRANPFLS